MVGYGERVAFECPCCLRTSEHPVDEAQSYCGACHWWTGDPLLGPAHLEAECPARDETRAATEREIARLAEQLGLQS